MKMTYEMPDGSKMTLERFMDGKTGKTETSNPQKEPSKGPEMYDVMDKALDAKKRKGAGTPSRQKSSDVTLEQFKAESKFKKEPTSGRFSKAQKNNPHEGGKY